jgi:integrase
MTDDYRMFLSNERGLDRATIYNYSRHIDRFLSERYGTGRVDLGDLQASEITAFVRREAPRFGRGQAAQVVTGLRSFLRFARYRGHIRVDLAAAVPCVANWALAGLPKGLPKGAVEQVLAHCNRSTVTGKRNYAILLLLARLGLRAGEIVAMRLEDVDWERAEITVRSKKGSGWARLPLPADVGKAIAEYLEGRPRSPYRNLFVRDYAPYTPFVASGPISVLVMKALKKAGVKSARTGAHVFRHTLATKMLKNGASLDEIGQVLRHKDPDTTAIYAKVDIEALRKLALPWPGGVR